MMQSRAVRSHAEQAARGEAAAVLRDARRRVHAGLDAADACGWALTLLPESPAAQRLMLDWLNRSNQAEHALTLIHATMRRNDRDWRLWLRRGRALLLAGRIHEADEAVDRALELRPFTRTVMLLGAEVAVRRGDDHGALTLLRQCEILWPGDADVAAATIDALLRLGRAAEACRVLDDAPMPSPVLRARVLAANNRLHDARETLEIALGVEDDAAQRIALEVALIDVLQASGDWPALRTLQAELTISDSASSARLAEATMAMGDFAGATARQQGDDHSRRRRTNSMMHMILAAAAGRRDEAIESATAFVAWEPNSLEQRRCQELWLRALLGVTLSEQVNARGARRAGADPAISIIEPLLAQAVSTFDTALRDFPEALAVTRWRDMGQACKDAQTREPTRAEAASRSSETEQTFEARASAALRRAA